MGGVKGVSGGFLDNYIIRVYRCRKDNPKKFVGTVEKVGLKGKMAFTSIQELWEILNCKVRKLQGYRKTGRLIAGIK